MSQLNDIPLTALNFYLTSPYECSYLATQEARSQVATPSILIDGAIYSQLVHHGFRRSGTHTYRPLCDGCQACIPLRIVVSAFQPNRTQRRVWKRYAQMEVSAHTLQDSPEYYALYQRYQHARHAGGGMDNDDYASYQHFLLESHVDSVLVTFREQGVLRMVSVVDALSDGLSAVYTFFDPDVPNSSFGVYNVLWQIELCRQLQLDYVYLGYWIENSRKMAYKTQYQPSEGLFEGVWRTIDRAASA
ncbi:MAG: arginyltransferase [Gallionella sp.]|nr:arginyltransferase [Gallionella sp.]MDD4957782.1 arginyltransferase [Gallionella sp.]